MRWLATTPSSGISEIASAARRCSRACRRLRLDRKESTRRTLKYRRGAGEVLIVNHEGRGWWDPQSTAKGDVFDLVRYLEPGLNFGHVRKVLRGRAGIPNHDSGSDEAALQNTR